MILVKTMHGDFSIGTMVMLIQLVNMARQPAMMMSFLVDAAQRAVAGSRDYFDVMALEPEASAPKELVAAAKLFRPMMEVYTIPGERTVNGRQWRTTCEPYSATVRCRTEIFATMIKKTATGFQTVNDWAFNSLTYRWAPRALWVGNPLGTNRTWTSAEGRQWRTECDSPNTGAGACRSYIMTTVYQYKAGKYVQNDQWVFNNQVLFSD